MKLTADNYYSNEANKEYFSVSQIKSFLDCPARTIAELNGEWVNEPNKAMLVGSYVDAFFEGVESFHEFKVEHPDLFKRDGTLKAEYVHADKMIERALNEPVFMEYMDGQKQVIATGTIDGYPFKCKFDVLHPERIVDLKTTRDFEPIYKPGEGRLSFIEAWGYTLQGAVYQAIEGHNKPFYIAAVTREAEPDVALVHIPQEYMDAELAAIRPRLMEFDAMKKGFIEPTRCEHCAYCKHTRKITGPIELDYFNEFVIGED